jgi:protoporphyrinogen oxidase
MTESPHVLVLGAGPAGVGAAWQLRRQGLARVTVLERGQQAGGVAGSFELNGQRLDFGSHRLHSASDPQILADIRRLLGEDLLDRPRHGRIRLRGRWVHFPLKPVDLLLHLDRRFALLTLRDMTTRMAGGRDGAGDSFAAVLRASLGPTICDSFYFPYARKIWGRAPEELSAVQARRRVSANSFSKLLRKVLRPLVPGSSDAKSRFFYPRRGYGAISEAYADAASREGAELLFGWTVKRLVAPGTDGPGWTVLAERDGEERSFNPDYVWSTIPVTALARMIEPAAPAAVLAAAGSLDYRSMLLVYLEIPVDRFTEYDAHYFPDASVRITRLSEPKNYAALSEPRGRTTLCAELPCSPDDPQWKMSDAELGRAVADDLAAVGIPLPAAPASVHVKRLRHAYPIYAQGYEKHFETLDAWVESLPLLLSYGRQGLFAHDNTHHALAMAYAAVDCLRDGSFDQDRWDGYRRTFESHVVED